MTAIRLVLATSLCISIGCAAKSDLRSYNASFNYLFTVSDLPDGTGEVQSWVPLPQDTPFQEISNLKIEPKPVAIKFDEEYGNRLAHLVWKAPGTSFPLEARITYDVKRQEGVAHEDETPKERMERYLRPDRLGIIDKRIRDLSESVTRGHDTNLAKARAIYDHVLDHMEYNKETPGWGKGDTERACQVGRGNCSDYHALFISIARAADIPARFHYGFSLKPEGKAGPHCWAEFHDSGRGWIPVDISEADKDPSRRDYFFGRLSENRILVTTGRDIRLNPPQKGERLNFLITPYVEVDGQSHEAVNLHSDHSPRHQ